INVRHGLGAGIILNGHLFQGDGGGAGEIGHTVVVPDGGLPCRCGNHGCLETVASAQALVKRAQALVRQARPTLLPRSPQEINLDAIESAFTSGDAAVQQLVLESGRYIGIAISNLIGALNIQKIVLVGDLTRFGKPWLDVIQETICQDTLSKLVQDTRVEIGQLDDNGIILGASALLANNYSLLFKRKLPREQ
ncbi:MAG TPA: ROK family protein, partial [Anaerolineales bacterium]